jgi:hypothetical protein
MAAVEPAVPGFNQDGGNPRRFGRPKIRRGVADVPRAGEIDIEISLRIEDQAGFRLAAIAADLELRAFARKTPVGVMGANVDSVEISVVTADFRFQPSMDAAQLRLGDLAARDDRLIADKDRPPFGFVQPSDRRPGEGKNLEIFGPANEPVFDVEGAVAIEEDGALRLIERCATDGARGSARCERALAVRACPRP